MKHVKKFKSVNEEIGFDFGPQKANSKEVWAEMTELHDEIMQIKRRLDRLEGRGRHPDMPGPR